jgi:hypothetical protein
MVPAVSPEMMSAMRFAARSVRRTDVIALLAESRKLPLA